jgi:hypothetical protein
MEISETQYEQIAHCLPVQRGNVRLSTFRSSILFCMSPDRAANGGASLSILDPGHGLYPHDALGQKRRPGSGIRGHASSANHPDQDRSRFPRQHDHQGAPRWYWRSKKTVPKLSANPAVAGPPKFIWLPRVIAAQSPSDSPPAKITMRPQDASF